MQGNETRPDSLQVLNVRSISKEECKHEKYDIAIEPHDGHMCTFNAGNEGTCAVSETRRNCFTDKNICNSELTETSRAIAVDRWYGMMNLSV